MCARSAIRYDYCQVSFNTGSLKPGFIYSYAWHPEVNTSILIFERQNMSKVHHVYLPYAKLFTHDLNAFEDTTHVYLDTLAYDNADGLVKMPLIKEVIAGLYMLTKGPIENSVLGPCKID